MINFFNVLNFTVKKKYLILVNLLFKLSNEKYNLQNKFI